MKKLPIADCRLPIETARLLTTAGAPIEGVKALVVGFSISRYRLPGCGHNRCKFVGLLEKLSQSLPRDYLRFSEQFEPKSSFVSLFLNDPNFCREFCLAPRSATRSVVRRNRRPTSYQLRGDCPSGNRSWDRSAKFENARRKRLGPSLQFPCVHERRIGCPSPIGNAQSPIANCQSAIPQ